MTAYPELLVNASNNSKVSPILIFSVTLNFMSQILEIFWFNYNHKYNSFKTTDFKFYFSILLLPNHSTPHSIQRNSYIYINTFKPSCNRCTPLFQNYLNSSTLHTLISQYTHVRQCTNFSMHMKTDSGLYMNSNNNSLYTFIHQHMTISLHTDLRIHIYPGTSPMIINLPIHGTLIQHLSLPRFVQYKHSQYNRLLFRSPIQC